MARRPYQLRRSDIRQETDKPTRSVILRYVGSGLGFDDYLYGYPDDTFFAVQLDELPWPEDLEALSQGLGIAIDPLPEAPRLRLAVADALAAGAMVDAPEHMDELGVDREVEWPRWELHDLERKHRIAEARVLELSRLLANDLKLRAAGMKSPSFAMPKVEDFLFGTPPTVPSVPMSALVREEVPVVVEQGTSCVEEVEGGYEPGSATVRRAREAVRLAREQELPQRLPSGMRRRLKQAPAAAYVIYGEVMDARVDLCAAMTDGRAMGRADRETVVVDYDGEWPVVVRRFGQGGRTIYKVEDALRRHGIEVPKEMAS